MRTYVLIKGKCRVIEVTNMPDGCPINNKGEHIVWCESEQKVYSDSEIIYL